MGHLSELSQLARKAEVLLGLRASKSVELPHDDADEFGSEILRQYSSAAEMLGVNMDNQSLREAINGYPHHFESAFLCLLESEDKLHDGVHATNFLCKALTEGWTVAFTIE